MHIISVIPARGGSKGIKRKNLRRLGGISLLEHSISASQKSKYIDETIVSTEDDEIAAEALRCGAIVDRRPEHLSTDTARAIEVAHHVLGNKQRSADIVVLLQPTSPLRSAADIDAAIGQLVDSNRPAIVSVNETAKSPHWVFTLDANNNLTSVLEIPKDTSRRQDMGSYYELNGAIYAARVNWFQGRSTFLSEETAAYVMPRERSIDIDTEMDLAVAEVLRSSEQTED